MTEMFFVEFQGAVYTFHDRAHMERWTAGKTGGVLLADDDPKVIALQRARVAAAQKRFNSLAEVAQ